MYRGIAVNGVTPLMDNWRYSERSDDVERKRSAPVRTLANRDDDGGRGRSREERERRRGLIALA